MRRPGESHLPASRRERTAFTVRSGGCVVPAHVKERVMQFSRSTRAGAIMVVAVAAVWLALGGLAVAATSAKTQAQQGYAGEKTCLTCHEEQVKGYHGSKHGQAWNAKTPAAGQGCESCHGPGRPTRTAAATRRRSTRSGSAERCERDVHELPQPGEHALWNGSAARPAQRRLHHLPQRARGQGREGAAQGEVARASCAPPATATR